jgi:holliday junction DNA helicase RuvA
MIGRLKGRIDEISEDAAIIDVGGVGYQVFCSSRTLAALSEGQAASLTIETHVREDHIHLYGFPDAAEREWFRLLCSVQGIGSRIGLTILGAHAPSALAQAILAKDAAAFRAISGIGPKLAERIVTELKDKVAKMPTSAMDSIRLAAAGTSDGKKKASTATDNSATEDAISALVNLGYTRSEAYAATLKAAQNAKGKGGLDQLIKLSLKELVRG